MLISLLHGLVGITAYAAFQHWLVASRRPSGRAHFWFALLCLVTVAYVVAEVWGYHAQSALEVVARRRWDSSFAMAFFLLFPWFVREYTGYRPLLAPVVLSAFLLVPLTVNFLLPHGVIFAELPEFSLLTLPWGEQVADLRVHQPTAWFYAGWSGMLAVLGYSLYAAAMQHRRGERRHARQLITALAVFTVLLLFNHVVNRGIVEFVHTAQFGFLALVLLMGHALMRERQETHQLMQALLDNVPGVVYAKDVQGRYLLINRSFEELFRVKDAAVAARTDEALFPATQARELRTHDRKVLDSRRPMEFEETVNLDDQARIFRTFKFPILHADGTPRAICGVSIDITDNRKVQQEIRALQGQIWHADRVARINAIGTSLSHELRQPLAATLANAESGLRWLARQEPDLDEFRAILHDIVRDTSRATAVIDNVGDMLRQNGGARARIPLAETIHEVLDLMQSDLRRRGVECERNLEPNCKVVADKVQIGQVVLNVVMNALDAMEDTRAGQKRLYVSVGPDRNGQACVVVRDTGSGLPSQESDRIFDPFCTTKSRGLGMGLALSRSIIVAHGGRIWAECQPGGGTAVQFVLPLATEIDA